MITISRIDPETGAFAGQVDQIDANAACPAGWVRAAAPAAPPAGKLQIWSDGVWTLFTPPAPDLAALRVAALEELADQRWLATQAFAYDGVVAPADSALGAVVGFVVGAQISAPTGPVTWKLARGEFRAWSLGQVQDYGIAIRMHIQACFDVEAGLAADIQAADSAQDIANIVAAASAAWPT